MSLQTVGPRALVVLALPVLVMAVMCAATEVKRLFWRARWLLVTVALLFAIATPGERLPMPSGLLGLATVPGVTVDGLVAAGEHVLRLVALLATLAWLWHALGRDGLMSGLYGLLRFLGARRDRLVVRLALALEYVEREARPGEWRARLAAIGTPDLASEAVVTTIRLAVTPFRLVDRLALAGCGLVILAVIVR